MTFDFSQLEITDSAVYQVVDARGNDVVIEGVPFTLTLASPGTKKAVNAQFKMDEARSARTFASMAGTKSKRTADDELRERADFLVAITESCSHPNIAYRGKTGLDALKQMYLEPKLGYIARGALKFHNDEGNFAGDSASSSPSTSATPLG